MRNILTILFLLSTSAVFAQKGVETITIKTSAVCDMCKETIEKEMAFTKGVTAASLDVATAILTVSFKIGKTDAATIRKAINRIGYDADDSPADPKAYDNLHHCCKKDSH
jgi:mercuric ion binding protein